MEYILKRSRRKTISIYITREAGVEVRAPYRVPRAELDRIVWEKREWIAGHLTKQKALLEKRLSFEKKPGDTLLYLGREYPLERRPCTQAGFDGRCFFIPEQQTFEQAKPQLVEVYRRLAGDYLPARVSYFANRMGLSPNRVRITGAKTRWGSCSGKDNLNFAWRLILAPPEAVDSVVVHELCHMRERNHGPRFWREVASVLPDYRGRDQALKALSRRLSEENWEK